MYAKCVVLALFLCLSATRISNALPPFRKPLDKRYAETDRELQREFRKVNCNLCHIKDKDSTFVNAYGKILAELIPGSAEDRLAAATLLGKVVRDDEYAIVMRELSEAIEKADAMKGPAEVTYGELFRSRTLPLADKRYASRVK